MKQIIPLLLTLLFIGCHSSQPAKVNTNTPADNPTVAEEAKISDSLESIADDEYYLWLDSLRIKMANSKFGLVGNLKDVKLVGRYETSHYIIAPPDMDGLTAQYKDRSIIYKDSDAIVTYTPYKVDSYYMNNRYNDVDNYYGGTEYRFDSALRLTYYNAFEGGVAFTKQYYYKGNSRFPEKATEDWSDHQETGTVVTHYKYDQFDAMGNWTRRTVLDSITDHWEEQLDGPDSFTKDTAYVANYTEALLIEYNNADTTAHNRYEGKI